MFFLSAFRSRRPPYRQLPRLPSSNYASAHERALLAALQHRRPLLLERLLNQVGAPAFAHMLGQLPTPHRMQTLHLLPDASRAAVCAQLSTSAGNDWAQRPQHWPQWQLFLLRRVWGSLLTPAVAAKK